MLKSVFFGTPEFAVPTLKVLVEKTQCLGVVCQPDKPRGRGQQVLPCPTKAAAMELGLPTFSPPSLIKPSAELESLNNFLAQNPADIFIVLAYGKLLPKSFLEGARLGCFNIHASLLPRWRGAAPIQRSIEAGDQKTGVCIQKMVQQLDAGNVILQSGCGLFAEDSAIDLTLRLQDMSAKLLAQFFDAISNNSLDLEGQRQEEGLVTLAPKISKEEAVFSESWTSTEAFNKIRAFRAWPQVRFRTREGIEIKILKAHLHRPGPELNEKLRPGELLFKGSKVFLGCAVRPGEDEHYLEIMEAQAPNKGPQNAFQLFSKI